MVLLFGEDGVVAITAAGDIFFNDSPYYVVFGCIDVSMRKPQRNGKKIR